MRLSMPQHRLPVLESAVAMFGGDVKAVFGDTLELVADNSDIDVRIDTAAVKSPQGFRLHVDDAGRLNVTGHDSHGAAYGLLEVSRLFGVSPWEWWHIYQRRRLGRDAVEFYDYGAGQPSRSHRPKD